MARFKNDDNPQGLFLAVIPADNYFRARLNGQLKYCYLQIAGQKFQGKIFTNKDTQNPVRVSRDGINEWWRIQKAGTYYFCIGIVNN